MEHMAGELKRHLSADENLRKSYEHDMSIQLPENSSVQGFRALIRPMGTAMSFVLSWTIAISLVVTNASVPKDSLQWDLIMSLHQLTVMAFVWWYGGRDTRHGIK